MTRLEVFRKTGLFTYGSIDDVIDECNETFGCPTGGDCPDDILCQDCWRKWLNEETDLEVVTK